MDAGEFEPVVFPRWVSTWWLQAIFFVLFLALGVVFTRLDPSDGWLFIAAGLLGWAGLLSLHAALLNRSRRGPGPVANWMFFLFPIACLVLLVAKYISQSGGT